jgi:methylenetetrahydrofolate dehydrogenase (NADP+)/methenyltetrahydrofolate cyclohydrolase
MTDYKVLDGKKVSGEIKKELKKYVKHRDITLGTLLVGNDIPSKIYINLKHKDCKEVGIKSLDIRLENNATTSDVLKQIEILNNKTTGYIVQMPLPKHIDSKKVINAINPNKDADGVHPFNLGSLDSLNTPKPCTPLGIIKLLDYYNIKLENKNALIIGRSKTVGIPISLMLLNRNATPTIAHSKTKNLSELLKKSDIVVVATGSMHLVKVAKSGATIIDVGVSRDMQTKKIYGDVSPKIYNKLYAVTLPVGGVGPMTRVMLLNNCVELFKLNNE